MGRWAPRDLAGTNRLTELQGNLDDLDEEPLDEYYQRQASAAVAQLEHVTDPTIRDRLESDLAHWLRLLAAASIDQHWDAGEGDRPLF